MYHSKSFKKPFFVFVLILLIGYILYHDRIQFPLIKLPQGSKSSILFGNNQENYEPTCGQVCDIKLNVPRVEVDYHALGDFRSTNARSLQPFVRKRFHCPSIIWRMAKSKNDIVSSVAPEVPPPALISQYLMDGGMTFGEPKYFSSQVYNPIDAKVYVNERSIDKLESDMKSGKPVGTYGRESTVKLYSVVEKYLKDPVANGFFTKGANSRNNGSGIKALVVGSINFWVEMILVKLGVDTVTTLEYAIINSTHPRLFPTVPYKFAASLLENASVSSIKDLEQAQIEPLFDLGVSYSSLEHSGLGRYGDKLDPYGDLEAMSQIWCLIKPGGLFFLNVPFTPTKKGIIEWNAHRIYHWGRIIQMAANWIIIENSEPKNRMSLGSKIFVLQKPLND